MIKLICGVVVVVLLAQNLAADTLTYRPAPERQFSGARATQQRQAAYASLRLQRATERLQRSITPSHETSCSPTRVNLLADATGKAKHKAKMIAANTSRAARLASK